MKDPNQWNQTSEDPTQKNPNSVINTRTKLCRTEEEQFRNYIQLQPMEPYSGRTNKGTKPRNQENKQTVRANDQNTFHCCQILCNSTIKTLSNNHLTSTSTKGERNYWGTRRATHVKTTKSLDNSVTVPHTHLAAKWVTARYSPRRRRCGLACAHPDVEVGATPSRRTSRSGGDSGGPPPSSSGRRAGRGPGYWLWGGGGGIGGSGGET